MPSTVVVACRVIQAELEEIRAGEPDIEIIYLDQALHRTPNRMPALIQEQIDRFDNGVERVVLGYGLCSNGVVGVQAGKQGLLIPRAHDCIALMMGSCAAYNACFAERPGTYYLSRGWIAERKDPLGIVDEEYTQRVGRDSAIWVMSEELKHYTHITLIRTCGIDKAIIERGRRNAEFFHKQFDQVSGSMGYFEKLLHGPYDETDFIFIPPRDRITQVHWFPEQ